MPGYRHVMLEEFRAEEFGLDHKNLGYFEGLRGVVFCVLGRLGQHPWGVNKLGPVRQGARWLTGLLQQSSVAGPE